MNLSEPARLLLQSLDQVRQFGCNDSPLDTIQDMSQAQQIQDEVVAARVARGEVRCGYKIGFTNRNIWPLYGVHHPIWGPVYQHTVRLLDEPSAQLDASAYCEPRLEPEIVVALAGAPTQASAEAVARALAWVAHGFEIVQSAFTDWQFCGAQAHAAQGLHGALLVGPRVTPQQLAANSDDLPAVLAGLKVSINRVTNGVEHTVEHGTGRNVLDGPLQAVAHLVAELAGRGRSLSAGDIITTGTMTDAQPVANGQQWQTRLADAGPLTDLHLQLHRAA